MTRLDHALRFARMGYPVLPLRGNKTPLTNNGYKGATTDPKCIRELWTKHPNALVGVATGEHSGPNGLLVVDVDPSGVAWLKQNRKRLLPAREQRTRRGVHLYYAYPKGSGITIGGGSIAPGVDHRGNGGYVVGWEAEDLEGHGAQLDDLPHPPAWVVQAALAKRPRSDEKNDLHEKDSVVIARVSDEELERQVRTGESFHDAMLHLTARAIARGEPEDDARKRLRALMFDSDGQDDPERKESWGITLKEIPRMLASAKLKYPQGAVRSQLRRNDNGKVIADEENLRVILEHDTSLAGLVRYDEFSMRRVLMRPIPGDPAVVADDEYPRQWRDEDTVAMQQCIQRNYIPTVAREKVDGALSAWVRARWAFHPVRDYLEGLEWDGKKRLDDWLKTYLQAKGAPDEYLRAVGAAWTISAVARIMEPGCQADYALVLEGRQGRKKSSALRALAGDEFFSDSLPADLSSKDAADHIRGKWIIELPELAQFRKSEIETVKSFVTRRTERFRPAYGRNEIEYPRQCVFAGTTNESQYLVDDTGNRRFWPVTCTGVNLFRLKRDRDQLWAEAFLRYERGDRWHIDPKIEALAAKQTERRRLDDPWLAELRQIVSTGALKDDDQLRPGQALQALGVPTEKMTAFNAARVGKILQTLGWRKKASNAKFYVRPEPPK